MNKLNVFGKWYDGLTYREAEFIIIQNQRQFMHDFLTAKQVPEEEIQQELAELTPYTIEKVFKRYSYYPLHLDIPKEKERYKNAAILFWCLKHQIPKGGRSMTLLKNLAILLLQMKITEKQRTQYAQLIMQHVSDIQDKTSIHNWMAFFRNRKDAHYNHHEINKWCKIHKLEYLTTKR